MVTLRKRVRTDESSRNSTTAEEKNPPEAPIVGSSSTREMASKSYEEARNERIKENFLRMQKLGILDLTQKLKYRFESSKPARKETPKSKSPPSVPPPRRRSSRLQKVTPGCHAESRKDGENSAGETKILGQDGNDARVPSGAKRARVLLVSEDGVVHFAQKSNPKSVAVPRLSSARKSDPKHTAAPENSAGETKNLRQNGDDAVVPSGAKRAKILLVSEDGVVHFAHESNPKSVAVPRLRSDKESDPKHTTAPENLTGETKIWRQDGDDVGVPSGAKRAKILLVSEDGVVHFAHESNPKSVSVPRLSLDKEIDPKHTAAPENLTGETKIWRQDGDDVGVPSGAKRAKILLVSEDGVVHFAHERNPKSVSVPRLSLDKEIDPKHTAAPENLTGETKISRQDGDDVGVPSGAKRAKILLVSEDGVVHFAHESNPKSVSVPRLSLDKEIDPKHTAAPENLTGETKISRQDGDDVGVPSGAKRAKILLVSEDGAVHFAHESNPKSGAVSRLSSDRESDSKRIAAPENCSNSACFGERRAQALVTPSESEVKPSMVPQHSSDNVIHAPFHYMPEPVMPATANSNDVCNGELGYKVTGIGAVSEPKKDAEAHLCSDSIYSVASSGKMKCSVWICDRTAGERDDIFGQEKATETFKQVEGEGIIQVHTKPFP